MLEDWWVEWCDRDGEHGGFRAGGYIRAFKEAARMSGEASLRQEDRRYVGMYDYGSGRGIVWWATKDYLDLLRFREGGDASQISFIRAVKRFINTGRKQDYALQNEESMVRANPRKEPWQMTFKEFSSLERDKFDEWWYHGKGSEHRPPGGPDIVSFGEDVRSDHRISVRNAIMDGKPVPPEVLADYPELARRYSKGGTVSMRRGGYSRAGRNPGRRTYYGVEDRDRRRPRTYYLGYYYDGRQLVGQLSDDLDGMSPEIVVDPPLIDFEASSDREAVLRARAELHPGADLEINLAHYRYVPIGSRASIANPSAMNRLQTLRVRR